MAIRDFTDEELEGIPLNQRNLLTAHVCNDRSYEEIANEHNIPLGTVKSRINRARLKIARKREAAAQDVIAA